MTIHTRTTNIWCPECHAAKMVFIAEEGKSGYLECPNCGYKDER